MTTFNSEDQRKYSLHVAKTLKAYRTLYGLSKRQAALQFEISPTRLKALEEPNDNMWPLPSMVTAIKLATRMHISLDHLFFGKRN